MLTCERVRGRLSAYVDGDLDEASRSALRGHLHTCEACRREAVAFGAMRDELAALPAPTPPTAMWAAIERRMAQAEVDDSQRGWAARARRRLGGWLRAVRPSAAMAIGGVAAAAVVGALVLRDRGEAGQPPHARAAASMPAAVGAAVAPGASAAQGTTPVVDDALAAPASRPGPALLRDVVDELDATVAIADARYASAVAELAGELRAERAAWSPARRTAFDAEVAAERAAVEAAATGRPREKAWRQLMATMQRALAAPQIAGLP